MAKFDVNAVFKVSGLAEVNASFKKVGKAAKTLGKDLRNVGSAASTFGRNLAGIGTVAGAALIGATARFAEFEKQFSNVVTLLDDGSFSVGNLEDGIKGLEKGVLDLRASTGETFENLNKGLFDLVSAGVEAADSITALKVATDLALAGATDTATAVDGITTVLGAFGDQAGTATAISQKFFTAQKAGKTTIAELADSIGLVAATAASSGVSVDELLASVSAATLAGVKTSAAFTGMKAALTNIKKPTKDAQVEAKRLGINFNESTLSALGLSDFLKQVTTSSKFTSESITKLFGSAEAMNFVLAISQNSFESMDGVLSDLNDKTLLATNFNNALAKQQDTLAFATTQLRGTADKLAVQIGGTLAPAFKDFFFFLRDIIVKFQPEIIAFFEGLGAKISEFVTELRADLPGTISFIRETVTGLIDAFSRMGNTVDILIGIFKTFMGLMKTLAAFVPGVSGETLALIAVLLQLTGGMRLLIAIVPLIISSFNLLKAAMIAVGVTSKIGLLAPFVSVMRAMAVSALASVAKIIPSLVALGTSMTTLGGIMKLVGGGAKLFWLFLTGPVGIIAVIVLGIGTMIAKMLGFKNIVEALSAAWAKVIAKVKMAVDWVKRFFGSSDTKEINVNVNKVTDDESNVPRLATGGHVSGPGTGTSDSIPARLSDGEYVVKARAVKSLGVGFMNSINNGVVPKIKKFASGGLVSSMNSALGTSGLLAGPSLVPVTSSALSAGRPLTLVLPNGQTVKTMTDEDTANKLQRELRRSDMNSSSDKPEWHR